MYSASPVLHASLVHATFVWVSRLANNEGYRGSFENARRFEPSQPGLPVRSHEPDP